MKYLNVVTLALPCLLISACGSSDALDAVEQAANNINTAVTDLSTAVNEGLENNTVSPTGTVQSDPGAAETPANPVTPASQTRPETFEDYQYSCNSFSNPNNNWVWSFRPDSDIADQFNLVTGTWEWVDNLQILIRPQGNPESLGTLSPNDNSRIFLENWGACTLRFGRSLTEQFTRPN